MHCETSINNKKFTSVNGRICIFFRCCKMFMKSYFISRCKISWSQFQRGNITLPKQEYVRELVNKSTALWDDSQFVAARPRLCAYENSGKDSLRANNLYRLHTE